MNTFIVSLRMLLGLTLVTGALYPAVVWGVGQAAFRAKAEGSLVHHGDRVVGSSLLAQKNDNPRYFWSRPSAGDYATVASGASHLSWSSTQLLERIKTRQTQGAERATTSGSGLDPHLSPSSVLAQLERVAQARQWTQVERMHCEALIAKLTTGGHFGPEVVNVLTLNLSLDQLTR